MSNKKKEKGKAPSQSPQGQGQFVCGKCTQRFPKAHGLAIHILRTHKRRTWGKGAAPGSKPIARPSLPTAKASKPAKERRSVAVMVCQKCGRDKFPKGIMSYTAHRRFCKGTGAPTVSPAPRVLTPATFPAVRTLGAQSVLPTFKDASHTGSNGQNQIERLKAVAAQKRREAEEIEKLVASFEADAQKLLSK